MNSLKIVIVSYTAYPSVAPRAQRTTELAKEMARQGHDVTMYVLKGDYDYTDFELKHNIKVKSLGRTFFLKFRHGNGTHYSIGTKIIKKLFGRVLEFPKIELAYHVSKVLKNEKNIDLLVSIAVPYPIHWGVAWHKQRNPEKFKNITWVADCGDPYMGNPFDSHPFYFKYIEKWFCRKADYITIPIEEARDAYYPEFQHKIKVIPQGFNFDDIKVGNYQKNEVPTFIYAGVFYPELRDPRPLLDYLINLDRNFKFIIYTRTQTLIEKYKNLLEGKLFVYDYIPREELLVQMSKADFLLNIENPSAKQSPSKLIDYALSQRPILSIKSNDEFGKNVVDKFFEGDYSDSLKIENIDQYDIKNITAKFLKLVKN